MLSILIPTYNYNVIPMVLELQKQCLESKINFEIIVFDDASRLFQNENSHINTLPNCSYCLLEKNVGRTRIRQLLAQKAKFEWLLFLDADVIPVSKNFIANYLGCLNFSYKIILGGYQYQDLKPKSSEILRYKYGKSREEKSASERNTNPYGSIFSGNLLIKKELFLATNYPENKNIYGMDIYFAYQLFRNKIAVLHIDNPIYHLGLETNEQFLMKSLESVKSRKEIMLDLEGIEEINSMVKHYIFLKKYRLTHLITTFVPLFKRNILSKNPNLLFFDLYRLGYMCSLK